MTFKVHYKLTTPLWLLQKPDVSPDLETLTKENTTDGDYSGIRCPKCKWQPTKRSHWMCSSSSGAPEFFSGGCGTVWNTFDTRGKCPGCNYRWKHTICLSCYGWSKHEDWYVKRVLN
jgi:hypothetical protein